MTLETRAVVVQAGKQSALVESSQANGCSACNGKGCGSGKLNQLFCSRPRQFTVDNRINAAVGDEVIIAVTEGAVLRGISLVYLMPLLLMFVAANLAGGFAAYADQRDGYQAAGALSGLMIGFIIARWLSKRLSRPSPYIARQYRE
jgi:sigma-E factor negative regulatory protein RseC